MHQEVRPAWWSPCSLQCQWHVVRLVVRLVIRLFVADQVDHIGGGTHSVTQERRVRRYRLPRPPQKHESRCRRATARSTRTSRRESAVLAELPAAHAAPSHVGPCCCVARGPMLRPPWAHAAASHAAWTHNSWACSPRTAALAAHEHSATDGRRRRPVAPARASRCRWAGLATPRYARHRRPVCARLLGVPYARTARGAGRDRQDDGGRASSRH